MKKSLTTLAIAAALILISRMPTSAEDTAGGAADRATDRAADRADRAADRAGEEGRDATERVGAAAGRGSRGEYERIITQGSKDEKFAAEASSMGMLEVQAAQLAQQKAQSDEVKQMARRLLEDHQKSNQQLMQITQSANIQIPREMNQVHRAMLHMLSLKQGEDFDKAFTYGQVADHTKAVLHFRDAAKECQNAELKQFAASQLPALRQHLQHAQKLANMDEEMTAGEHIRGTGAGRSDRQRGNDRSGTGTDSERGTGTSGRSSGTDTNSGAGSR